ncbi:MAG: hypothetical protein WCH79_16765, partial [Planctomycetia bacterium]
ILRANVDAVVSPANSAGFMDGGIDLAYRNRFGLGIQARVQELIAARYAGEMPIGAAALVSTGDARIPRMVVAPTMETPRSIVGVRQDASFRTNLMLANATDAALDVDVACFGHGAPLVGGFLHSYAAGTLTPLATYVDHAGITTNANPVVLDSTGSANVWFGSSAYKLVLKTATGSTLWSVDSYQPESAAATLQANLASTASAALGDALVGVKSALTGGTARTQHDKNADVVSVKDFSASPSNTAAQNDTAFTLAVAGLPTTGGKVTVPAGTYDLLGTWAWGDKPFDIIGDGRGVSVLQWTGANTMLSCGAATLCSIKGLSFLKKTGNASTINYAMDLTIHRYLGSRADGKRADIPQ